MKKIAAVIAFAAVLMLVSAPTRAAQPVHITAPFSIFTACTGDTVDGTLDASIQASSTVKNGIAHVSIHETLHGTGTGTPSGASYVLNEVENATENVKLVNGTGELNLVINGHLISKGGASNENIKILEHVTVNANGTVTVDRLTITDNCT